MDLFKVGLWADIVIYIDFKKKSNIIEMTRDLKLNYGHAWAIINALEDHHLIKTEKVGVKKLIILTKKGREVSDALGKIRDILGGI